MFVLFVCKVHLVVAASCHKACLFGSEQHFVSEASA